MVISVRKVGVVEVEVVAIEVGVEKPEHAWVGDRGEGGAEGRVVGRSLSWLIDLLRLLLTLLQARGAEDGGGGRGGFHWWGGERGAGQVRKKIRWISWHL